MPNSHSTNPPTSSSPNLKDPASQRLQELEQQIDREHRQQAHQAQSMVQPWQVWMRRAGSTLLILGCILAVGLALRVLGDVLKLAILGGLGFALYQWVVLPRLKKPQD